jgi:hypothetical protein
MKRRWIPLATPVVALMVAWTGSSAGTLAEIEGLGRDEIRVQGFTLDRSGEVQIQATALVLDKRSRDRILTDAWILNAEDREVVWTLDEASGEEKDGLLWSFSDSPRLEDGSYEVYCSTYLRNAYDVRDRKVRGLEDVIGRALEGILEWDRGDLDRGEVRDLLPQLGLKVGGNGTGYGGDTIQRYHAERLEESFFVATALRNDAYQRTGFLLERPATIEIYAVGEIVGDSEYDYGAIVDNATGKTVWRMKETNSREAGGAEKNREVRAEVKLPSGDYTAFFATDDSHAFEQWNAPPPHDPLYWGMTLRVAGPRDRRNLKVYDIEEALEKNRIVDLTKAEDHEFLSRGFTLKRPMDLRIYAVGEGSDGRMYDYGWIVDARTRRKVWTMEYDRTEQAGGAEKNRVTREVVPFDEGSYIAYFVTDGSHSYEDWNASPPYDREGWGLSVFGAGERFRRRDVVPYEEGERGAVARIDRVRNGRSEQKPFTLDRRTTVRIYALGEGSDGRMYDYGWIENVESGRVIWEMTYRMTDHAGGAEKNRMFDGTLVLEPGRYELHYVTDDSHSYGSWNGARPYDPASWGIAVYEVE